MLSEHERAAIQSTLREILDDEERRYVVEAASRAAALAHRGNSLLNLGRAPLRMR